MQKVDARIILLGTAGGAVTWGSADSSGLCRYGTSTALVIGGKIYVVDFGMGVARQLTKANPLGRPESQIFEDLQTLFITHMHSDHTLDLSNLLLCGYNQGWPSHRVEVYGPWDRVLSPSFYSDLPELDIWTPGAEKFVNNLLAAFEAETLDRVYGAKKRSPQDMIVGVNVQRPGVIDRDTHGKFYESGEADPEVKLNHNEAPVDPFFVYEDDRVYVTATLAEHGTMYPAFAYRFDTDEGSVVFSGDTGPSENLVRLAADANVLIHEVIDPNYARWQFGDPPYTPKQQQALDVVFKKHCSVEVVGTIAQRCSVQTLVLNHFVPGNLSQGSWASKVKGFDGRIIEGRDLDTVYLTNV
ncbi:MBL fold metallo-hydrolase [Varibaculum massiliense]|uniref:MBL fold metallo-hydrolase n=1 Tax=Varibaculum massiliense TaxID=1852372 RepID=UPI002889CF1C|nr:MBL fold metallo-hydrolase [Varibaculum massiliense]